MPEDRWSELDLITWLQSRDAIPVSPETLGIGDDCAALPGLSGRLRLVTTDLSVEGIHFRRDFGSPRSLGRRAAGVSLSDVAAMGGRPGFVLAGVSLPVGMSRGEAQELLGGLAQRSEESGASLIGGDITRTSGPITLAVTVLGEVPPEEMIRRCGACPGDHLLVSGSLGDAAAALAGLDAGLEQEDWWEPQRRHLADPEPEVPLGRLLGRSRLVSAAIDLSDGLAGDLRHLCRASNVGAEIRLPDLPITEPVRLLAERLGRNPLDWALSGGDDYRLLLTVPSSGLAELTELVARSGRSLVEIGRMTGTPGIEIRNHLGATQRLERTGYEHAG